MFFEPLLRRVSVYRREDKFFCIDCILLGICSIVRWKFVRDKNEFLIGEEEISYVLDDNNIIIIKKM